LKFGPGSPFQDFGGQVREKLLDLVPAFSSGVGETSPVIVENGAGLGRTAQVWKKSRLRQS